MSYIRQTEVDKAATLRLLNNAALAQPLPCDLDDPQGRSWLGHSRGARQLDIQLLQSSTMKELMAVSGRTQLSVISHFYHLRDKHGLEVIETNGLYRLNVNESIPLYDFVYKMVMQSVHGTI